MSTQPRRLRRKEASLYLHEKYGISRAPSTLAKDVSVGSGGPAYQKAGRIPLYAPEDLDIYAQSLLSPKVTNSMQLRKLASKPMEVQKKATAKAETCANKQEKIKGAA